jgi:hypothetical protein
MVRKGAIEGIHFALGWGNSDGPLHWRGVTNHFVAEISFAHTDALAHESWIAVAHLDQRENTGKIFLAAPLEPSDLEEFIKTREAIRWDSRNRQLIAASETRLGTLLLRTKPLALPDLPDPAVCPGRTFP